MEEIILKSEICEIGLIRQLDTLHEIWKIANSPIMEFKIVCNQILLNCIQWGIKNIIIDTSGAVSLLPESHQLWLAEEFNSRILLETQVETIILISPDSLVTKISTDLFYQNITKKNHGIIIIKIKSYPEAVKWLQNRKKMKGAEL